MATPNQKLCTQCKTNPRTNPEGTNTWCTSCNTRYQKERQALAANRTEAEGFVKGVRALRKLLIDELCKAGGAMMKANEVAIWIGSVPTPTIEESESDTGEPNASPAPEPALAK